MKKVDFMLTAFRDGFQSAYGARVFTKDFLPAVEAARAAGIRYFEAGGGARFQSLYFYCNEDAFDMMDQFRKAAGPDAILQTLARGVNVVALDSQPSDIIELHAKLFKKHGIDVIRNFDALNDVDNLIDSAAFIRKHGLKHQVCVTLMSLPPGCVGAHDPAFYEKTLRNILDAGIPYDAVCYKDASGTTTPAVVYETIKRAREILGKDAYIHFHTHDTAGIGVICNRAALDAGANAIDLSLAPCSGGTCQPDVLTMWHALRHTEYDLDVDVDKIREATDVFKDCMKDYFLPPEAVMVEPMIPWCPMPGGALTANTQMLRDNNIMHRYPEILRAMGEVVAKGGFGTSVTPVSQFYFQQAFTNVMQGPWQQIAKDFGRMVLGYFGKTPVPPDPEVVRLASEKLGLPPTTEKVLDRLNADPTLGIKPCTEELKKHNLPITEENIFIVASCGAKGIAFLKGEAKVGVRKNTPKAAEPAAPAAPATPPPPPPAPTPVHTRGRYNVSVDGKSFSVDIDGNEATVNGRSYRVHAIPHTPTVGAAASEGDPHEVKLLSQADGTVYVIKAKVGQRVKAGDTLMVLESMKMEMAVKVPHDGLIREINVRVGDPVSSGQLIAILRED